MKLRREMAQSPSQIRGTANIYATINSHKSSITAVPVIKAIQIYCIVLYPILITYLLHIAKYRTREMGCHKFGDKQCHTPCTPSLLQNNLQDQV